VNTLERRQLRAPEHGSRNIYKTPQAVTEITGCDKQKPNKKAIVLICRLRIAQTP
jgi:hypothetical protein